jgi:inner membrane protein
MDSLTHIAIGACIGDLFLGKKIGKKAMLYGAIAASLPDIDFLAALWLNTADNLMAHRGITHSFLFAFAVVAGLAFFFRHRHRVENIPIKTWLFFMATEILLHLFLDAFNAYGVGWFEPFSHSRFSFNSIFVADPVFSIWPGIAAFALLILNRLSRKRKAWAWFGLVFCFVYFLDCQANKFKIDNDTRYALIHQNIHYTNYFSTPAPFNSLLWYLVAEVDSGYYIGYRSVFDKTSHVDFRYFPRQADKLQTLKGRKDLLQLLRFSQGFYIVDTSAYGLVFNDLRFGQIQGWRNRAAPFAFHYYLQEPDANKMIVQRGRFADWDWESVKIFWRRIRGKTDD